MATPSISTPGFSRKRIFPEYWPAEPGTQRTHLQYPHGPVPELCLALPWYTAAGGTQHRSPVPIFPLGLDKTNFPRILNPRGTKGATISTTLIRSRTWTLTSGCVTRGSEIRFKHMATTLVLYPGFLDKTNFPLILTRQARYPQVTSTIPTRSRPWTLPGFSVVHRCLGHPAQVSCAHLPCGAR